MLLAAVPNTSVEQDTFVFPASFAQERLWFLDQLEPNRATYNMVSTARISTPLNREALEQSLNSLIQRHEILRTTFLVQDGQPMQAVAPTLTVPLPLVDLQALPRSQRQAEALRFANQEAQQLFDLAHGPLLRLHLLRLEAQEHLLLLVIHHSIFDGWSIGVFFRELETLYQAEVTKQPALLPDLPIQYADFAAWQREWLQGPMLAEHLSYWKTRLAEAPNVLELLTDRPRPPVANTRGANCLFTLPQPLSKELKAMSQRERVSLFTILTAAFQTLLSRYSGQEDLLLGTVAADRGLPETKHLIGFFVNTLVLRTDLSGNPTFRELIGRVREGLLQAQKHQDVPFEYLVKELQPDRSSSQNPFFQVMLVFESIVSTPSEGWLIDQMDVETNTAKFELHLGLQDRPEGLRCRFEYNTDLFDGTTIARMADHWQTLLEGIVAHPEQQLSELPLLTEAERHQLLVQWNATATEYSDLQCIHQLFETQVEQTPDAHALVFENEHLSYRELNNKANQLAHSLQLLGVGPEVLVGLYVERSLDMVVALLGILKAGGAYVPLDPTFPTERLGFMLADAQVSVLVTQQSLVPGLPEHNAHVICMDTDWNDISLMSKANASSEVKGENAVYVIYTSGSTGKPKGVTIEHKNLSNYLHGIVQRLDIPAGSSFATVSSLATDLGNTTIFPSLCTGGCLHVISRERAIDHHALEDYFSSHSIDCLKITPTHFAALLASSQTGRIMPHQRLVIGGEAFSWKWVNKLQTLAPDCTIFNHYGPTEATVGVLTYRVQKEQGESTYTTTPMGRPIGNTQVYVLDTYQHPVPIGVAGELYIGGASVARGYLNRPELTAEKFIANPFTTQFGGRMFRTGDLVRYLPDGNIEFLGRIDDQVKIRGFRIELGEIEEVLSQHPAVREAVVLAREDTPGNKYLIAYIVPMQEHASTTSSIHTYLKENLPVYMVPASIMKLAALPLTPSGKVDRRALPAPDMSRRRVEEAFAIPTRPIHFQLIKIWEELLDARPIGIRDNFFFLGGHSLLAARLVARMEQVFGKKIPLATLFTQPTIEQLAQVLLGREDIRPSSPMVAVQAAGTKRPFFYLHGDYKSGAFYCLLLARDLGNDQPFYALDPPKTDGLQFPSSLEEMAATNIQLLRTVQPEGPYLLGGFCNGGLIAYEMARQLHTQGESVDLLLLIDPTPVGYARLLHRMVNRFGNLIGLSQHKQHYLFLWLRHAYKYLLHFYRYSKYPHYRGLQTELNTEQIYIEGGIVAALKSLFELQCGQGVKHSRTDKQMVSGSKHSIMREALRRLRSIFPDALFPQFETLSHSWDGMFHWSVADYVPGFYPGKSTFIFSWDGECHKKKWYKLAKVKDKAVEIHIIAGTHDTCKTEYLHHFTERLQLCLSKAQAVNPDS